TRRSSDLDGPSIRDHRITKPYFRTCSTDKSRSLAPFYLYARCLIANQAEGTYWAPPLLFRRRPPQSNCPTDTVRCLVSQESTLELNHEQGGISPTAPPTLACRLHSLPPILHSTLQTPMPSYSEGPGVFPSCCAKRASLLVLQFRRACG